jgi:hypothetical protein
MEEAEAALVVDRQPGAAARFLAFPTPCERSRGSLGADNRSPADRSFTHIRTNQCEVDGIPDRSGRVLLVGDEHGNAEAQLFGHLFAAVVRHQFAEVDLEIEGFDARWAIIEVLLNLGPRFGRQFVVEEVIEAVKHLSTVT